MFLCIVLCNYLILCLKDGKEVSGSAPDGQPKNNVVGQWCLAS